MLETIIKNIGFTLLLLSRLIPHPHTTAFDAHQRQVKSKFFISWPIVRSDMRLGHKCTKKSVMVEIRDMFLNQRHRKWHLLTIVVEFHVVKL